MKEVIAVMFADLYHPGDFNIINDAIKLGKIIVGILTDQCP